MYKRQGVRDYIHVMDLAEGHVRTLDYLKNNNSMNISMNIGTSKGTSVLELIDIFQSEIEYVKEVLTSSNSGIKKTEDLLEASQWHDENFKSK